MQLILVRDAPERFVWWEWFMQASHFSVTFYDKSKPYSHNNKSVNETGLNVSKTQRTATKHELVGSIKKKSKSILSCGKSVNECKYKGQYC